MTQLDRFYGSLIGLAVGDCLGMPWEFQQRGTFPKVTGMSTGGAHGAALAERSDNTSMAMCLAESLIEHQGWNPVDANFLAKEVDKIQSSGYVAHTLEARSFAGPRRIRSRKRFSWRST